MPPIKFSEVISYSSEDSKYPADNLLKPELNKTWKCQPNTTDKQSYVILKLDRLSSIKSIDIGNDGSAFIEILAARDGTDFQVILVASSFMSPLESRNEKETNRVRMFGPDKLNKVAMEQKWDRIKVVCFQPFNKSIQCGVSFIKVIGPGDDSKSEETKPVKKLGLFSLKDDEEEDDQKLISVGSFFAKRKENKEEVSASSVAAIRAASNTLKINDPDSPNSTKRKLEEKESSSSKLLKKDQDSRSTPSPTAIRKSHDSSTPSESKKYKKSDERERSYKSSDEKNSSHKSSKSRDSYKSDKESSHRSKSDKDSYHKSKDRDSSSSHKHRSDKDSSHSHSHSSSKNKHDSSHDRNRSDNSPKSTSQSSKSSSSAQTKDHRPFKKLMKDVSFVLSGYQNPLRSQLRDKMTSMGAEYRSDWDPKCTHLICAYTNTPKFKAVKGKGKIVSEHWVQDCHKDKKRYPWRRYDLEKKKGDESEDEIWADEIMPQEKTEIPKTNPTEQESYNEETDNSDSDRSVDTDDEIQGVLKKQKKDKETDSTATPPSSSTATSSKTSETSKTNGTSPKSSCNGITNDDNIFDMDTDVDEEETEQLPDTSNIELPVLPSFFKGKRFLLHGKQMDNKLKRLLSRYIIAYDGKVSDYMSEEISYVISEESWNEEFDEALNENSNLHFVKPKWIWKCCDKNTFVPHQPFLIVP